MLIKKSIKTISLSLSLSPSSYTHIGSFSPPDRWSCGSAHSSWSCSEAGSRGCTPDLPAAPALSADTCVRAAATLAAAESAFSSRGQRCLRGLPAAGAFYFLHPVTCSWLLKMIKLKLGCLAPVAVGKWSGGSGLEVWLSMKAKKLISIANISTHYRSSITSYRWCG